MEFSTDRNNAKHGTASHWRRNSQDDADYNAALQNRLAMETCEKDGAKTELRQLKKIVDSHRRSLSFLSEERGSEHVWLRLEDAFYQLEQDLSSEGKQLRTTMDDVASPPRTYDVLRNALNDAQRRVESLNNDMKHQQNANSEIVRSLASVKDTNKQLIEQIQHQTGEITQLTGQRVNDEYKLDDLQKQHRQEEQLWHKDLERRLQQRKHALEDRYSSDEKQYLERHNHVKMRAGVLLQALHALRQIQQEMKAEHCTNMDTMMKRLHTVEEDIFSHMEKQSERHLQTRTYLQHNVQDLDVKLGSAKLMRVHEVAEWKQKHAALQAEKEDTTENLSREISQLTTQVHCMERTVQSEESQNAERREKLEATIKKQVDEKNSLERTLETVNRELFRLETQVTSLESDEKMKEQQLKELRVELRRTDDALHAQQNANDHLRQQLEEQRDRFQTTNDKELQRARQAADEKLKAAKDLYDQDEQLGRQQLAALADLIDTKEADLEHKKQQCESVIAENSALERDIQMWKNMFEQTNKQRVEHEQELGNLRLDWTRRRLSIQETVDVTEGKCQTAETDLDIMSNQFVEFKRQTSARETEITSRISALEEQLKTTKYHLQDAKVQLSEVTEHLRKVKNEGLMENQKQTEIIHKLERELDQQSFEWQEEKKRLDNALESERRATNEHRERFEKWKEVHQQSLRQLQEESTIRLQNCDREKNRLAEKSRQELENARKDLEMNQRKVEQLKEQISRSRNSYHEAQGALESVKRETQRNERSLSMMKQQYADEYRTVQAAGEAARKSESSMSRQYEQSKVRYDQDRKKMMKEFEDMKATGSAQLSEAEKRHHHAKTEFDSKLTQERSRLSTEMVLERTKMDGLVRENDQLKKILGDRPPAYGLDKANLRASLSPTRGSTLNISPRSPKHTIAARHMRNIPS